MLYPYCVLTGSPRFGFRRFHHREQFIAKGCAYAPRSAPLPGHRPARRTRSSETSSRAPRIAAGAQFSFNTAAPWRSAAASALATSSAAAGDQDVVRTALLGLERSAPWFSG